MLTKRQQELLNFLRAAHKENGIMPSNREIQHHFGFASQTAALDLLKALERKGVIRRVPGKARAVILTNGRDDDPAVLTPSKARVIPLLGRIAAGMPEEQSEAAESITIDGELLGIPQGAHAFALRVRGDSMIDAHILEGDIVVLAQKTPRAGDIVAALIDGETTLKRFVVVNGKPCLKAENAAYPNLIPAQELIVQGVMLALLRAAA